jgi:hypothetical protein
MKKCPLCSTDYPSHHTTCPSDGATLIEGAHLGTRHNHQG